MMGGVEFKTFLFINSSKDELKDSEKRNMYIKSENETLLS